MFDAFCFVINHYKRMTMKRDEFLKTLSFASATVLTGSATASSALNKGTDKMNIQTHMKEQMRQNADKIRLGVSTYCYQHAIYTGEMTTEDCLAEMNSIGAESVQIIDGITVPNFPDPPECWVEQWFEWMEKYKLTPSLMNTFLDVYWGWRHRPMDLVEQVKTLIKQLKLARRLGFNVIRPTSTTVSEPVGEWLDAIVPYAEDLNVKVAPELHSPIPLKGAFVDRIMETIIKTGTKHIGFTFDFGDLPLPFSKERSIEIGSLTEEIAEYIERSKKRGVDIDKVQAKVNTMNPKQGDLYYINRVYGMGINAQSGMTAPQGSNLFGTAYNDPNDLIPLVPYIFNCHGKFYVMTEDCMETTLDYEGGMKALIEGGFSGYIDSEYEGQRALHNQWCEPINEVEQVRRHHIMMRRLLGRV